MAFGERIKSFANDMMDLVYPGSIYCICCGNAIDETRTYPLCDHCIKKIGWDREPPVLKNDIGCMRCCQYDIFSRTIIFSLKYNGKKYIARDVARMMADKLRYLYGESVPYDLVIPVPMFKEKEMKRGFNQAALIGKHLAEELGIPHDEDILVRTRDTAPMRGLSPDERKDNIRGSFALVPGAEDFVRCKRVLLIDDFFTTGATASECRKVLSPASPEDVTLYAFAAR